MNFVVMLLTPKLRAYLASVDSFSPYFSLTWILTWYSHEYPNPRLFDLFLAYGLSVLSSVPLIRTGPIMVLYLSACIIRVFEYEILSLEPDFSTVHHFLSRLGDRVFLASPDRLENIISQAILMYKERPLSMAQMEQYFGRHSCITRFHIDVLQGQFSNTEDLVAKQELENTQNIVRVVPSKSLTLPRWVLEQAVAVLAAGAVISFFLEAQ